MGVEIKHIGDLKPDDRNERKHSPRGEGLVVQSLQEVGAWRSIAVDENLTVMAGNGVVTAAAEVGIEKVLVVDADANTLVAVRRTGLTDAQKRAYAILDNRAGEFSEFDPTQLSHNADDFGFDLLNVGFNEAEIAALANDLLADAATANEPASDKELQVLVTCRDFEQQQELIGRLKSEGFKCKGRRRKAGTS